MPDRTGSDPIPVWVYATIFGGFIVLYAAAMPANHIESVDRHAYAMWAETLPLSSLLDTRSILFTALNRSLYLLAKATGAGLPATTLITCYSVLAGAGASALMARLLNRFYGLQPGAAIGGALLFGLSYGVWRYAMEVEVYVASIFLVLSALLFLLGRLARPVLSATSFLLPGLVSGLVVMFYQPNVFPMFLAVPVLFLARDRLVPFIVYGATGTATVVFAYVVAFHYSRAAPLSVESLLAFIGSRNAEFVADPVNLTSLSKMVLAISHTLLSSNWVFGIDSLTEVFRGRFPATEIETRVLSAAHYRPWVYAPLALTPLIAIAVALLIRRTGRGQSADRRLLAYPLVWLVIYGGVAGRLDPGVAEVWITVIPVWVILGSVFILAPAMLQGRQRLVYVLILSVALWNWFGGIGMLKNPDGDFFNRQTAGLAQNIGGNDLIVMTDATWKSRTYLEHVLGVSVLAIRPACDPGIAAEAALLQTALARTKATGGRVFVFQGFVEPSPRLAHVADCPSFRENAVALAASVAANIRHVAGEGAFSVYEIAP